MPDIETAARSAAPDVDSARRIDEPVAVTDDVPASFAALPAVGAMPVPGLVGGAPLRRLASGDDPLGGTAAPAGVLEVLRRRSGGGSALPGSVAGAMGEQFGADLSAVRVHHDAEANGVASAVQSVAFTHGRDIYFSRGAYDPGSQAGQRLLAHELAHVTAGERGGGTTIIGRADDPAEHAADRTADRVVGALRRTASEPRPLFAVQTGTAEGRRFRGEREDGAVGAVIRPGPGTAIRRRTALTTKRIVSALQGIPQFRAKMGEKFRDELVRERIEQTLRAYKAHVATKKDEDVDLRDAMMLSAALERIAHQFAEELNDPSVTSTLMPQMFEIFEADIGAKLKKKRGMRNNAVRANVLALAKALSGSDPVTQYMHREIRKEVAAQQIITMADKHADLTPAKVFDLMSERWQAALSTYTRDQQKAVVKDAAGDFNRAEAHGEYSPEFFQRTFGSQEPTWQAGAAGGAESLALTGDAQRLLDDLRTEVANPTRQVAVTPRAGVTEGQERHLAQLEANEATMSPVDSDFLTLFNERYNLTAAASRRLLADIEHFLSTDMKLTITVNLEKWFGTDTAPRTPRPMFAPAVSAKDTTQLQDLFNKTTTKTIEHLPTWDDSNLGASARGPSYLRFRHWKDQLMTGLQDLSSGEMASFGSGNITWDTVKGSDTAAGFGTNYYGDLHFVLDRAKFDSRIVFTAGDHGEPRRNPLLALHDLCGEGKGRTWLRSVRDLAVIDNVVNAVRSKLPLAGLGLKLEFQVFGGIDMLNDVTEVWLARTHSSEALERVQAFYRGKRVLVQALGAAPPGTLEGGGGNLNEGLVPQLRPLVAYGGGLSPEEHNDVVGTRTAEIDGATASIYRDLLASCIVMSIGLRRHADAIRGHLEPGDSEALTKARNDLNKRWTTLESHLKKVDSKFVTRVTDRVAQANSAVDAALQGGQEGEEATPDPAPEQNARQRRNPPQVPPRPNRVGGVLQVQN